MLVCVTMHELTLVLIISQKNVFFKFFMNLKSPQTTACGDLNFNTLCNYSGRPSPHIRISNTSCSFSPLTRLKMLICGGGALLGSKCMKIKVSYVQARRFVDFHTLILNSYNNFQIIYLPVYAIPNHVLPEDRYLLRGCTVCELRAYRSSSGSRRNLCFQAVEGSR